MTIGVHVEGLLHTSLLESVRLDDTYHTAYNFLLPGCVHRLGHVTESVVFYVEAPVVHNLALCLHFLLHGLFRPEVLPAKQDGGSAAEGGNSMVAKDASLNDIRGD